MSRLLVLPLLLLLAACGGGGGVADPPSSAPASVASDPPTPSASGAPGHETAKEFIRRFTAVEDAMQNSGETSAYASLSDACKSCSALVAKVTQIYKAGGKINYAGTRVTSIHKVGGYTFDYQVDLARTIYTDSASAAPTTLPGGDVTYEIELRPKDDSWITVRTAQIAGSSS